MSLQFTQEEVESELGHILKDRKNLARVSSLSESYIKRQYNPDDETVSCAFRTLQVGCAQDELDPERGEEFWRALLRFRELSKKRPGGKVCIGKETGNLNKEVSDVVSAHLEGKSFYEQLKEVDEVEAQAKRTREAILCAIDKERELLRREFNLETQKAFR